jgi:hypothetical protein
MIRAFVKGNDGEAKAGVYVETVYEDRNGGLRSERSSGHS